MSNQIYQEIRENLETKLRSISQFTDQQIIEKGFDPLSYRLFLMENCSQEKIEFSWQKLEQTQKRLWEMRKKSMMIVLFDYFGGGWDGPKASDLENSSIKQKMRKLKPEESAVERKLWLELNKMLVEGSNSDFFGEIFETRESIIFCLQQDLNISKVINLYEKVINAVYENIYNLASTKEIHNLKEALNISKNAFHHIIKDLDGDLFKLNMSNDSAYFECIDDLYQMQNYKIVGNYQKADQIRSQIQAKSFQIDDYPWGWGVWWRGD